MGIILYSLVWVMQDVYHQPYYDVKTQALNLTRLLELQVRGDRVLFLHLWWLRPAQTPETGLEKCSDLETGSG